MQERHGPARAEQLQFLRFLAFCPVFLLHAEAWGFDWFPGGYGACCAVSFFIMLSGLVAGYAHFGDDIPVTPRSVGGYMRRKIQRIYPLYGFTMLLAVSYSAIPGLVARGDFGAMRKPLLSLLRNALMLQSWFTADYFSFNSAGWFVSTILFAYLLTLPMLSVARRIGRSKRPATGFGLCAAGLALGCVGYCWLTRNTEMEYTQYVLPAARLWEYAIGMCLGCLARLVAPRIRGHRALLTLAEAAALALWIAAPYLPMPAWHYRIVHWLIPNALLLTAFALGGGLLSRAFRARPLVALGDLSFECYLLHTGIIIAHSRNLAVWRAGQMGNALRQAGRAAEAAAQSSALGNAFNLILCMALTLMLAALVHQGRRSRAPR